MGGRAVTAIERLRLSIKLDTCVVDHVGDEIADRYQLTVAVWGMVQSDWWSTVPASFNKRGEQHYYSLVFNDDAIRLCNECSGEIDCA